MIRDRGASRHEMCYRDPSELPYDGGGCGGGCFQQTCGRAASSTAKNMIGEGGDFQERVDGREKGNKEDWKPGEELDCGKGACGREAQGPEDQISDHVDYSRGDNLVEGILDKAAKPAPEEPLHFWNDKERNEDRTNQDADGGGDKAVGDNDQRDSLGRRKQNDHDYINRSTKEVSPTG